VSSNAGLRARQAEELAAEQLAAPLAPAWPAELGRLQRHCRSAEEAVSEAERHIDAEESRARQRRVAHREECAAIRKAAARREFALQARIGELERERAARDDEVAAIREDVAEFSVRASGVIRSLRERVLELERTAPASRGTVSDSGSSGDGDSVLALQRELERRASSRSANFSRAVSELDPDGPGAREPGRTARGNLSVSNFFRSIDSCGDVVDDIGWQPTTISSVGSASESTASSFECAQSVVALDAVVSQLEAGVTPSGSQGEQLRELYAEEARLNALEAALNLGMAQLGGETLPADAAFSVSHMPSFSVAQTDVEQLRERISELHGIRQCQSHLDESSTALETRLAELRSEREELFEYAFSENLLDCCPRRPSKESTVQ
jgi:hypothetical protein